MPAPKRARLEPNQGSDGSVTENQRDGKKSRAADSTHVASMTRKPAISIAGAAKFALWNVNGIRSVLRPSRRDPGKVPLLAYVEEQAPDILCLNETRISDAQVHEFEGVLPSYRGFFSCSEKKGYAGVGTFVREDSNLQVEFYSQGLSKSQHDSEGRVQTFIVRAKTGTKSRIAVPDFFLVNTYVVNAGRQLARLNYKVESFNEDLHAYLLTLQRKLPVLWTGDLNVAHQAIDIWNSKACSKYAGHTPQERKSFGDFLAKSGFKDVFREFYPDRVEYTFWPAVQPSNYDNDRGWRLDYFVASSDFFSFCSDLIHQRDIRGSDHCPVELLLAPNVHPSRDEDQQNLHEDNITAAKPQ